MQYIYTMKGLGKVHPPDAVVLKDIWLSFFPGAKIGVLGLNGAGKSSLLKIMAGEDHEFIGEAFPADGISAGFLPQEPRLDPTKDVKGNIELAVAGTRALLNKHEELSNKLSEPLDPASDCPASRDYSKAYLHHLVKSDEILGQVLLSWHNLAVFQGLMTAARAAIREGHLGALRRELASRQAD